jgi:hypothetical protein
MTMPDDEDTQPGLKRPEETPAEESAAETTPEEADATRRWLLTRLALGSVLAFGLGSGAAILVNSRRRTVIALPNGEELQVEGGVVEVAQLAAQLDSITSQLAAVTDERDRLSNDLSGAYTELETLREQLAAVTAERDEAQQLNALWEAHDEVGLDALLAGALAALGGVWVLLLPLADALRSGLETGRGILQTLMDALPGPQDGIRWLQEQINTLSSSLAWLADQIKDIVEPIEPLASAIADFVLWVLEHLPFGIGRDAQAGLEAMQDIIGGLPNLVDGVNGSVLDPLAEWFGQNVEANFLGTLINPLLEDVFNPAGEVLAKLSDLDSDYQTELAVPVQQALTTRAAIREQITELQA